MEISRAIVKILQTFPHVRLPDGYLTEPTGQEKQHWGFSSRVPRVAKLF